MNEGTVRIRILTYVGVVSAFAPRKLVLSRSERRPYGKGVTLPGESYCQGIGFWGN